MWRLIREEGNKQKVSTTVKSENQMAETKESINFVPIDTFHLADLNILRGRVTKLLLNSPDYTHVTKDLVITLVSLQDFSFTHRIHGSQRDSKIRPKRNVVFSAHG